MPMKKKTPTVTGTGQLFASVSTLGFQMVSRISGIMIRPNTRSKVPSVSWLMPKAPTAAPMSAGETMGMSDFGSTVLPSRLNETYEVTVDVKMPTLFEPFAAPPGTPANTSNGTVSMEPPPAIAFTAPAKAPPTSKMSASNKVTASSYR